MDSFVIPAPLLPANPCSEPAPPSPLEHPVLPSDPPLPRLANPYSEIVPSSLVIQPEPISNEQDFAAIYRQEHREWEASPEWTSALAYASSKAGPSSPPPTLPADIPATLEPAPDPIPVVEPTGQASHDQVHRLLLGQAAGDPLLTSQIEVVSSLCAFQLGTHFTAASTVCPICQEAFGTGQPRAVTQCFHTYHARCLAQSQSRSFNLEGTCHVCRSPLALNSTAGL